MTDKRKYADMTTEELDRRLREAFFYPDKIDGTVYRELEAIRGELIHTITPEEGWVRFLEDRGAELETLWSRTEKPGRLRVPLRAVLIAAAIVVLLAGAALAAGPLGLTAWVPRWNSTAGRYEPMVEETEKPIPAALRELGITEPVYPTRLPEGFVLTESHVSEDPLVLMEQYARGDRLFTITVTPIKGFRNVVYPGDGASYREYGADKTVHYLFRNEETIIAVRYTESYATTVSGYISLAEIGTIMDSFGGPMEGGGGA